MGVSVSHGGTAEAQPMVTPGLASDIAKFWWLWIVTGIAWVAAALVILQFNHASITTVGVIIGIMFAFAAIQEFVAMAMGDHLRWLSGLVGAVFAICAIISFVHPQNTFAGVADILGFLFLTVGIWWTITAFLTKDINPVWWLGLITGILMISLAFWTSGQFFIQKSYTLLVFAGIWALMHGISDIFRAFQVRTAGRAL
jgi:uncharacterized membrane protein HdeD (DUF308 family)